MSDVAFQSATELTKAIRERRIGSAELLEMYIERYERLNPKINAIVATDLGTARKRAKQADDALVKGDNWGPLHGLPMTIKDAMEVAEVPCTWGSPELKDFIPERNAVVVQPLINAGAVIYGRTNVPLFAMDSQTFNEVYGQTNNIYFTQFLCNGIIGLSNYHYSVCLWYNTSAGVVEHRSKYQVRG